MTDDQYREAAIRLLTLRAVYQDEVRRFGFASLDATIALLRQTATILAMREADARQSQGLLPC